MAENKASTLGPVGAVGSLEGDPAWPPDLACWCVSSWGLGTESSPVLSAKVHHQVWSIGAQGLARRELPVRRPTPTIRAQCLHYGHLSDIVIHSEPSRHHAHRRRHPHAPTSTRNDIHWKCDGKSSGSGISKKNPEDIVLCEAELSLHLSPHHLSSRRGLDRGLQLSAAPGVIHTALSVHGNVVYSTRGDGRASGGAPSPRTPKLLQVKDLCKPCHSFIVSF
ncbi:unnamed protein product [Gadus morhua 'NCC']